MTDVQNLMEAIGGSIDAIIEDLIEIRHDIHTHPELGYNETRTSKLIQTFLDDASIEYVPDLAKGTGVLAHIPGNADQAIALRADIDALPILEENEFAWKSVHEGRMHACGHDGKLIALPSLLPQFTWHVSIKGNRSSQMNGKGSAESAEGEFSIFTLSSTFSCFAAVIGRHVGCCTRRRLSVSMLPAGTTRATEIKSNILQQGFIAEHCRVIAFDHLVPSLLKG